MANQQATEGSHQAQRKLRNFMIARDSQMRLLFPAMALFFNVSVLLVALYFTAVKNLNEIIPPEVSGASDVAAASFGGVLQQFMLTFFVGTFLLAIATMLLGVVYSHRVFGPKVAIMRHIRALNSGDYDARLRLRGQDEFHDMADALNQLATTLKEKK